ncbi:hypothetical protein [Antrihabitans cavernicola]|uniref:Uncharacterized protein n=1 Tax=Antrihabitans cavernicola TaxID=2495913 RepID=A0A5A7SH58_9NOCA|nr:hypothetical protein [Spelaeibacter cavernicola]KAA0023825.1 hypothetical protein FOY51_04300 [Spelaeibacter cavernicola]
MSRRFWPVRVRVGRATVVACAALLIVGTAYGPAKVASALGLHQAPAPAPESVGYLPPPFPVVVKSPTVRLTNLQKVVVNHPIPLTNGAASPPDTIYLRFNEVDLDNLTITELQPRAPQEPLYSFEIANRGSGAETAAIGNKTATTELWGKVNSLKICITAQTLATVVNTYAGVLGGRLDSLLQLIGSIFAPFANSPLGPVGPCVQLTALLPVLEVLIDYGVPLPNVLPVTDLDVNVYALSVATSPDSPSIKLPKAEVRGLP